MMTNGIRCRCDGRIATSKAGVYRYSIESIHRIVLFLIGVLVLLTFDPNLSYAQRAGPLEAWVANWRVQIFKDTQKPSDARGGIRLVTARNEYEAAQIVLRSTSPFTIQRVASDFNFRYNFVDYVHASKNSGGPGWCDGTMVDPVRQAPADFPEQLSNDTSRNVAANETQSIWVKFYIPTNTPVGYYEGEVIVSTSLGLVNVPVLIEVNQPRLPDPENGEFSSEFWIFPHTIPAVFGYQDLSDQWWSVVDDFANLMRESRMNSHAVRTQYLYSKDNSWGAYDRYVQRFKNTGGLKRITTETMREFATQYAPMLEAHLRQKGWYDLFYMKLIDEPQNAGAYVEASNALKRVAPTMKVGDPGIQNPAPYGTAVDIWIPHITYDGGYDKYSAQFEEIKRLPGAEVWTYTTCLPTQGQINLHIDDHVYELELYGWYAYSRDLSGFLFWGGANWEQYPDWPHFQHVGTLGDAWMIYPDTAKGTIMSSIRVEAAREMAEDHELFRILEKVNPSLARGIVNSVIRSPSDFEKDPNVIQQRRNQLVRQTL